MWVYLNDPNNKSTQSHLSMPKFASLLRTALFLTLANSYGLSPVIIAELCQIYRVK